MAYSLAVSGETLYGLQFPYRQVVEVTFPSGSAKMANINSDSFTFAGLSALPGGPFTDRTIELPASATSMYILAGDGGSRGYFGVVNLSNGKKSKGEFTVSREVYALDSTYSSKIFDAVSSFFDLFEDKDTLLRYWNCWQMMATDADAIVEYTDHDDHINEISAFHKRMNFVFRIDYRKLTYVGGAFPYCFSLDAPVSGIPKMQDMIIKTNRSTLLEGIDYVVSDGSLYLKQLLARSGEVLSFFCPVVYLDDEAPQKNFGVLVDLVDSSSESYLAAIRALWYAYWNGPSIENIRNAVSVACGIPISQSQAVVLEVTNTSIKLSNGQIVNIPNGCYPLVKKGAMVGPFKALLDGIEVADRTTGEHLANVDVGVLFRVFGKTGKGDWRPSVWYRLVDLYGSLAPVAWMKRVLSRHVHVIRVDFNKVLRMDRFYGEVLRSLIMKFRPKQDFALAIFSGKFGDDTITLSDTVSVAGNVDLRYTVKRNPADFFDAPSGSDDKDDYIADPQNYTWANLDAQVMCITDTLCIYSGQPGGPWNIPMYPPATVHFNSALAHGSSFASAFGIGGGPYEQLMSLQADGDSTASATADIGGLTELMYTAGSGSSGP